MSRTTLVARAGGRWFERKQRHRQQAFTLLELLLGLTLLVAMMALIYSALRLGVRAWDASDQRVNEAAHWRVVEQFLRREFSQVFPSRWRGATVAQLAFEGTKTDLKYVTAHSLEATTKTAGFAWAQLGLVESVLPDGTRGYSLQLNRQNFDIQAKDWSTLTDPPSPSSGSSALSKDAQAPVPPVRLLDGIASMELAYFGAENDTNIPEWFDSWNSANRLPQLIRVKLQTVQGREVPPLVFALSIGEEAGCLEQSFVRVCGARPRAR